MSAAGSGLSPGHRPSRSRVRAEFYEALSSIAPPGLDRFLPAITGAMANEMALLLDRAGFAIEALYGDWDLGPFESESSRMIWIARRRA